MSVSDDKKIEILNDHYKMTVGGFKDTARSRDMAFVTVIALLGLMLLQVAAPSQSQTLLTQIVNGWLNSNAAYSISLLGSLVWASLLFMTVRYFQTVINIEREYNYSHQLETLLSEHFGGEAFTKEGRHYLDDYPLFSNWLHLIYRWLLPSGIFILISYKIYCEWHSDMVMTVAVVPDTTIYVGLAMSIIYYIVSLYKTKKDEIESLHG